MSVSQSHKDAVEQLKNHISKLYPSPKYSDLVIHAGCIEKESFLAHKAIVSRCKLLADRISRESDALNLTGIPITTSIELPQDSKLIAAMLSFLYTCSYDAPGPDDSLLLLHAPLCFHALMYNLAFKYDVPNMKDYAKAKFNETLYEDKYSAKEFFFAAEEIYLFNDHGLRACVASTLSSRASELLRDEDNQALLTENPDLAVDVVMLQANIPIGRSRTSPAAQVRLHIPTFSKEMQSAKQSGLAKRRRLQ